jgi:hypothetical protein
MTMHYFITPEMERIMTEAAEAGLELTPGDFGHDPDDKTLTIDGMPAEEWLAAMTADGEDEAAEG